MPKFMTIKKLYMPHYPIWANDKWLGVRVRCEDYIV